MMFADLALTLAMMYYIIIKYYMTKRYRASSF